MHIKTLITLVGCCSSLAAVSAATTASRDDIDASVNSANRPPAQVAQDARRRPDALLRFAGVKRGDRVADFMPGNGYFTRLLSTIVGRGGRVYAFIPNEQIANCDPREIAGTRALDHDPAYPNVSVTSGPALGYRAPEKLDALWLVLGYHDLHDAFMGSPDVVALDRRFFAALKPGGKLLIVDHVAQAGSGLRDTDTLHRIDPTSLRREIEAAGFVLIDQSDILRNSADDHSRGVFDQTIRGHTDQIVLLFRRP